ncbi:hypothetical protein BJV78DRAFT_1235360 [Lactifluus subvellereus]|nr:hypothetical protein BJV78DRAFT_1235360 [Lactifluus subvellereus]
MEERSANPNDALPLPYSFAVGQSQGDLVVERGPSLSMDISRERSPTPIENAASMPGHAVPYHILPSQSRSLRQSSAQAPSSGTTPPGIPSRAKPRRSGSTRSNGQQGSRQAGEDVQPGGGISRVGPPIAGEPDALTNTQPARTELIHPLVPSPGQPNLSGQPGDSGGPGDSGQLGDARKSKRGWQSRAEASCLCFHCESGSYKYGYCECWSGIVCQWCCRWCDCWEGCDCCEWCRCWESCCCWFCYCTAPGPGPFSDACGCSPGRA